MSLLDEVRAVLADADLPSFRLYGEDLVALAPDRLRRAADEHDANVEKHVPPSLRKAVVEERTELLRAAHAFLTRYNPSIHNRIRGYLELGRRMEFAYPWPVVAILGIMEVMRTIRTVHLLGLAGGALERVGYSKLGETVERTDDVLRRTNRGIFADSVPTVLFALRCHELRTMDREDLARAILAGPRPIWMDAESKAIAQSLYEGLAVADPEQRFERLVCADAPTFRSRAGDIFSSHGHPEGPTESRKAAGLVLPGARSTVGGRPPHRARKARLRAVSAPRRLSDARSRCSGRSVRSSFRAIGHSLPCGLPSRGRLGPAPVWAELTGRATFPRVRRVLWALLCAGCSLVDSVDDYAGPPLASTRTPVRRVAGQEESRTPPPDVTPPRIARMKIPARSTVVLADSVATTRMSRRSATTRTHATGRRPAPRMVAAFRAPPPLPTTATTARWIAAIRSSASCTIPSRIRM